MSFSAVPPNEWCAMQDVRFWSCVKGSANLTERTLSPNNLFMKIKPMSQTHGVVMELGEGESQLLGQSAENQNSGTLPFKIKNILVPIDFSDCSRKALKYAIPFARHFNATLTLIHVAECKNPPAG